MLLGFMKPLISFTVISRLLLTRQLFAASLMKFPNSLGMVFISLKGIAQAYEKLYKDLAHPLYSPNSIFTFAPTYPALNVDERNLKSQKNFSAWPSFRPGNFLSFT